MLVICAFGGLQGPGPQGHCRRKTYTIPQQSARRCSGQPLGFLWLTACAALPLRVRAMRLQGKKICVQMSDDIAAWEYRHGETLLRVEGVRGW